MQTRGEYTVTQLTLEIKDLLESGFNRVWVTGEVSNVRRPASGHVYFTLKDEKSQIRAVLFRSFGRGRTDESSRNSQLLLDEGITVLCCGRIGVYQERGEYQLVVEIVEPRGYGALQRAFEVLKQQLESEGLFAAGHKKALPFLPRAVGVVTSPTGSVIRDILEITKRRFPAIPIYLAPARVQGTESAAEIVLALEALQTIAEVEVIILARGGGTLEDLAPFNDERVARAIFAARIPVVSAVGHETDFTIADFVADLRSPTPSAAAELVVPLWRDLKRRVEERRVGLTTAMTRYLQERNERLKRTMDALRDPRRLLQDRRFAIDDRLELIRSFGLKRLKTAKLTVEKLTIQLPHLSPDSTITRGKNMIDKYRADFSTLAQSSMSLRKAAFSSLLAQINALSPLAVLNRGYSITVTWPGQKVLRDSRLLKHDTLVAVRLARGSFKAQVTDITEE